MILADPLFERAGDPALALIDAGTREQLSWRGLDGLASTRAGEITRQGVRRGHRVALLAQPGAEFASWLFGTIRAGATVIPVSPRIDPASLQAIDTEAKPRLWVRGGDIEARPELDSPAPEDAFVVYTSGTSGQPKGVRLTLANQIASAAGCAEALDVTPADVWLAPLSVAHIGGLAVFVRAAVLGFTILTVPEFSEQQVLEAMSDYRPTIASLVPTMLVRLLAAGGLDQLRQLRAILLGGSPSPAHEIQAWTELGLTVCPSYGLTETGSQVTVVPPGCAAEMAGSSGLSHSRASLHIQDGRILVAGPVVSPGYLGPASSEGPDGNSFLTRDLGAIDARGVLTVLGRMDDVIITGGEKVHPEAVEAVLRTHPSIVDAAVRGRADPTWGQVVEALLVGDGSSVEGIKGWCRERLPPSSLPRRYTWVSALPRTPGGKLLRGLLPPLTQTEP